MSKTKTPKTGLTRKHWIGYGLGDFGGCMTLRSKPCRSFTY